MFKESAKACDPKWMAERFLYGEGKEGGFMGGETQYRLMSNEQRI